MIAALVARLRPMLQASPATGRLSLRANFSWAFAGNVVYAACQWGMLTALARLGTPEAVGQFSLGLAVGAPVMMLANLQLRAIQATDARRAYAFGEYLALRLATTIVAYGLIAALALTCYNRADVALVILALGLQKVFHALSDVYHGLLQQRERMDRIARSLLLKGPLALAALTIAYALSRSVAWAALALAAVYAAVWWGYDRRSAKLVAIDEPLRPCWSRQRLLRLAWLALPLGLVMMLISLNANLPRYLIERTLGEAELGIYSALAYLQVAGSTVVMALGQSASPRLAQHYAAGQRRAFQCLLRRLVGLGAALGLVTVLGALFVGKPALALLYGAEYAARNDVLVWLMVAAGVGYMASFLQYGMIAARCLRSQLVLYAVTAGTIAALGVALLSSRGLQGIALALTVGELVRFLGSGWILHRSGGRPRESGIT